jgi:hypothetical protein
MDPRVFVAELRGKTQPAALLDAAEAENAKVVVFLASASALVLTSRLGVVAGTHGHKERRRTRGLHRDPGPPVARGLRQLRLLRGRL